MKNIAIDKFNLLRPALVIAIAGIFASGCTAERYEKKSYAKSSSIPICQSGGKEVHSLIESDTAFINAVTGTWTVCKKKKGHYSAGTEFVFTSENGVLTKVERARRGPNSSRNEKIKEYKLVGAITHNREKSTVEFIFEKGHDHNALFTFDFNSKPATFTYKIVDVKKESGTFMAKDAHGEGSGVGH